MKIIHNALSVNLLKNFLESKIYFGSSEFITKTNFNYYLHGWRNKKGIINLNLTFQSLNKLSYLIYFFFKQKKKIVFLGFPNWFNKKWRFLETLSDKNYVFFDYSWNYNYLLKNRKKIGVLIVFNDYTKLKELKKEVPKLNIPLIGFSSNEQHEFDYIIPGNFTSKKGVLFLYYFFLNFVKTK